MMSGADNWLRRWNDVRLPRLRVVCFPPAGGTAQDFAAWPAGLPGDVEVLAVQYPGRQDRIREPYATDVAGLAGPVASAIEPLLTVPLVLFGHSMGAVVAYETTLLLERRFGRVVELLAVSGSVAPDVSRVTEVHLGSDAEIVADVRRRNPRIGPLLDVPGLVDVLVPTFRADYRVIERYRRDEPVEVCADLLVLGGNNDADVPVAALDRWLAVGPASSTVRTFEGGHFYLADRQSEFLTEFSSAIGLSPGCAPEYPMSGIRHALIQGHSN